MDKRESGAIETFPEIKVPNGAVGDLLATHHDELPQIDSELLSQITQNLAEPSQAVEKTKKFNSIKYRFGVGDKSISLSYRQASLLAIAMQNPSIPLTEADFESKGMAMDRRQISFIQIIDPLRKRIIEGLKTGILFEVKENENGDTTYTYHPPVKQNVYLKKSDKQTIPYVDPSSKPKKEKSSNNFEDLRPDYLVPDTSLIEGRGDWNQIRSRFGLIAINKNPRRSLDENLYEEAKTLKFRLGDPNSPKPTAKEAVAVLQGYMLLTKEVPDPDDEKAMSLLDEVHGFIGKYISHTLRTKVEVAIDQLNKIDGKLGDEMTRAIRLNVKSKIIDYLRNADLTKVHDLTEANFKLKIIEMVGQAYREIQTKD